jgi:glycosyltransferase involved in cell wall biosynthesis
MHVLCIGGEDHALRIPFLTALQNRGLQVSAAGTGDSVPFSINRIPYHRYQFDRFGTRLRDTAAIGQLAQLIRTVGPDVIQTFDTKPNLLAPLAMRGAIPIVRTINGMGWVFSSTDVKAVAFRPVYLALQRLAACWTTTTVFQNSADSEYFHRYGLLGNNTSAIIGGSGIDLDAFQAARISAVSTNERLRTQLGLDKDDEVVLTVSRLTVQKGIPTLLQAAKIVQQIRPSARFVLVGPRESEGPFAVNQALIDRSPVMALGARSDVPALLGIANVFAFPTEYREGIPRVLLEAGLAGLPIVTTNMPGCGDVVTDNWNGRLVPPRDPPTLAGAILGLLQNPTRATLMGARSIGLIRQKFDLNIVADRYTDLYTQTNSHRRTH